MRARDHKDSFGKQPSRLAVETFFLEESVTPGLHPKHCTKRMWFREVPSGTKLSVYPVNVRAKLLSNPFPSIRRAISCLDNLCWYSYYN